MILGGRNPNRKKDKVSPMSVLPEQIRERNTKPMTKGRYGLYWMQAAQRAHWNHALEHAIGLANGQGLPLVVLFCLVDDFPEANLRHYRFMLEGLAETRKDLEKKGIKLVVRLGSRKNWSPKWRARRPGWLPMRDICASSGSGARKWRPDWIAGWWRWRPTASCRWTAASEKENFSAGTLRPADPPPVAPIPGAP